MSASNVVLNNDSIVVRNNMNTMRRCNKDVNKNKMICMTRDNTYKERKELVDDIFIFSPIVLIILIAYLLK